MSNVKFTIITVCFNDIEGLKKTAESVLTQDYVNFEYIVVDGASQDGTPEYLKELAEKNSKVSFVSEKDGGIYDAMNKGIKMATGDIIGLLNAGDTYEAGTLSKVAAKYDPSVPYQVIYGMLRYVNRGVEEKVMMVNHSILEREMICHPASFVSKTTYDHFGGYTMKYPSAADYEFMLRLHDSKEVTFTPIHEILTNFEAGGVSGSSKGILDDLRLRRDRGTLSQTRYLWNVLKYKIRH